MAGNNVRFDIGKFRWTFTQSSGDPPTEFRLRWGTSSGSYPNTEVYPTTSPNEDFLYNVLPGLGQYYAVMLALNAAGNGSQSAEVPFVVVAGPINIQMNSGVYVIAGTYVDFIWRANWLRVTR